MLGLASVIPSFLACSFLGSWLAAAPAAAAPPPRQPPPGDPAEPAADRLQRGYLRVEGLVAPAVTEPAAAQAVRLRAELVDALVLRVPHLAFEPFEAAAGVELGDRAAFVDVRAVPGAAAPQDAAFDLTIVVSDGRAFDRRVQAGADEPETVRLLASTIANLLLAIEADSVEADRGDVPVPAPVAAPAAPPCPCECPAAPVCPAPPTAAAPVEPAPPRIELGPTLSLVSVLGLGQPAAADRFAALGASVGVHARLRSGAFVGVSLRTAGRGESQGNRLVRQRVALGAGYELRRDGWALEASLWGSAEPWWVVGDPIDPAPRPQWGLFARVAPSLYRARLGGSRMGLSVGPVIELGGSATLTRSGPRIGVVVVQDADEAVRSRLRVGGLELTTGLGATLWFGLPRARAS